MQGWVLAILVIACRAAAHSAHFLQDDEGWIVEGVAVEAIMHAPSMLKAGDSGFHSWYFVAPSKFLGDQSDMIGGSLNYKLGFLGYQGEWQQGEYDVLLASNKHRMSLGMRSVIPPRAFLSLAEVWLCADCGWEVVGNVGGAPSSKDFESVLSSLSSVKIRGGFYSGAEDVYLMSVKMKTAAAERKSIPTQKYAQDDAQWVALNVEGGVMGLNQTHLFCSVHMREARGAVALKDIVSVDVDNKGFIQVLQDGDGPILACGFLKGYKDVPKVAKVLEEAKRRSDTLRGESARGERKQATAQGHTKSSTTTYVTQKEQKPRGGGGGAKTIGNDDVDDEDVQKRRTGGGEGTNEARGSAREMEHVEARRGSTRQQDADPRMSEDLRRKVREEEKRLHINPVTMLRRVDGIQGSVLLTADAVIVILVDASGKVTSKSLGLHELVLQHSAGTIRLGTAQSKDEVSLRIDAFPFQELMLLIDDASKLLGLR